jgi:hypothetical protein
MRRQVPGFGQGFCSAQEILMVSLALVALVSLETYPLQQVIDEVASIECLSTTGKRRVRKRSEKRRPCGE